MFIGAICGWASGFFSYLIPNRSRDFEVLIEAAEAINDISGMPLPEHLSQTILSHSIQSDDPDQQVEALVLISEQHYPDTTFYSETLLASPNEEVRKFAIQILANNYDKNRAAAIVADHVLSNPVSMANILINELADHYSRTTDKLDDPAPGYSHTKWLSGKPLLNQD